MNKTVEIAVIGAGHAGLNAVKEIRKVTDSWVLINGGPLGTTCARIGCMPSKVAIHLAETYETRKHLPRLGIEGTEQLHLDQGRALEHLRDLRDTFVDLVLANTTDEMDQEQLLQGYAEFADARRVRVGEQTVEAERFVIATGARSVVPPEWIDPASESGALADGILTVDNLFELDALPESVAVIGLGPIGLEMGQALHALGVQVIGIERGQGIARISDPRVGQSACEIIERQFPLWLGQEPTIERVEGDFCVRSGEREAKVEKILFALGRRPNLDRLGLDRLGVELDARGIPKHDRATRKLRSLPIYLAGDADGDVANLQRAAEQGRIAGFNASHRAQRRWRRRTPMSIIFTQPNIAFVGQRWEDLDQDRVVVAQQRFGPVGRALIIGQNRGLMRIYAERRRGRLLGAEMIGPRCEHLAHLLAWAVENRMTVERALEMPFYHPVIEEALQDALLELRTELGSARKQRKRSVFFPAFGKRRPADRDDVVADPAG